MLRQFIRELLAFLYKWAWCFFWHRRHHCFPEVWARHSTVWHCRKCHPCTEKLEELMKYQENQE